MCHQFAPVFANPATYVYLQANNDIHLQLQQTPRRGRAGPPPARATHLTIILILVIVLFWNNFTLFPRRKSGNAY